MKKLLFIIFLMVFSFAITANAKKPKIVWPKAVLTLKDGTVLNGYLQNDIHFMKKNIYFRKIQDSRYKIPCGGQCYARRQAAHFHSYR